MIEEKIYLKVYLNIFFEIFFMKESWNLSSVLPWLYILQNWVRVKLSGMCPLPWDTASPQSGHLYYHQSHPTACPATGSPSPMRHSIASDMETLPSVWCSSHTAYLPKKFERLETICMRVFLMEHCKSSATRHTINVKNILLFDKSCSIQNLTLTEF